MRKLERKGFTIVELVIVIAVIAILSAILIPTFTGVIENAEKSAAKSNAKSEYQKYALEMADEDAANDFVYKYKDFYVAIKDGQVAEGVYESAEEAVLVFGTTNVDGNDVALYQVAAAEAYKIVVADDPSTGGVNEEERITFTGLYEVTPTE